MGVGGFVVLEIAEVFGGNEVVDCGGSILLRIEREV